ncbi:MAG: DNA-protecting protein DprA [Candidatus Kerfeldbacteria bacterium]|nr:DNA-protecting protein DprA [Candidatus Kerfeldbacteria bacterium]
MNSSSINHLTLAALHRVAPVTERVLHLLMDSALLSQPLATWTLSDLEHLGLPADRALAILQALPEVSIDDTADQLHRYSIQVILHADPDYPDQLREIASPPPLLYVRGRLDSIQRSGLAVVGTRRPSPYGLGVLRPLLQPVIQQGLTIVSGLALGIDGSAHQLAVDAQRPTIAVLGCGLNQVYPWEHRQLASDIVRHGGAIMSEFPLGARPERHHFPQRNRIISGLAQAVLLVEAGERSGALVTAKFAVDQNREVLVVPGPITSPQSVGPLNWLKLGATPVTSANDILAVFNRSAAVSTAATAPPLARNDTEARILAITGAGPTHVDEIIEKSRLDSSVVAAALSLLEVDGLVRHLGGSIYILSA